MSPLCGRPHSIACLCTGTSGPPARSPCTALSHTGGNMHHMGAMVRAAVGSTSSRLSCSSQAARAATRTWQHHAAGATTTPGMLSVVGGPNGPSRQAWAAFPSPIMQAWWSQAPQGTRGLPGAHVQPFKPPPFRPGGLQLRRAVPGPPWTATSAQHTCAGRLRHRLQPAGGALLEEAARGSEQPAHRPCCRCSSSARGRCWGGWVCSRMRPPRRLHTSGHCGSTPLDRMNAQVPDWLPARQSIITSCS